MKRHIPNFLTLLNLTAGTLGIMFSLYYKEIWYWSVFMIFISAVFDFSDGFFARLLNAPSPIGKELDSLADLVSFGLNPAFIMFQIFAQITDNQFVFLSVLLIILFSALRLAKFNIDETQKKVFSGLPTPALALFVAGLALDFVYFKIADFIFKPYFLLILIIIFSFLLVAPIKLFSLKISKPLKNNKLQIFFLLFSALLILFLKGIGLSLTIIFYIILSVCFKSKFDIIS